MFSQFKRKFILVCGVIAASFLLTAIPVSAKSFTYDNYQADIVVNEDTTVDVTETLTYRFNGEFRGVIRSILLEDRTRDSGCRASGSACGGFERVALLGVYDGNGKELPSDAYELYVESDEDTGVSHLTIKWVVWPDGKTFNGNTTFSWSIAYRVYGSIFYDSATKLPYVYWNAIPGNRGGSADQGEVYLTLPKGAQADSDNLDVFTVRSVMYEVEAVNNVLHIVTDPMSTGVGDFTIAYLLDKDTLEKSAHLSYGAKILPWTGPWLGQYVKLDGVSLGDIGGWLDNFPTGTHTIEFSFPGYESKVITLTARPDQDIYIDATLSPSPIMWVLIVLNMCGLLAGVVLIPLALIFVYFRWRNKGRDKDMPSTIVPLFSPPEGVQPYMLGSLKDEKVDKEDITATIIDLAYRGYLKIKEVSKGKDYELTRLEGKPEDAGLNKIEKQLLNDLFNGKQTVQTKKLGEKFARKYQMLVKKIDKEMVERGYFTTSPTTTRGIYLGCGIGLLFTGIAALVGLVLVGLSAIGIPGPGTIGLAMLLGGIALAIVANYMPAKTAEGSRVFAEILGFRMYLYTAERYRLQGLEPEEFERYLSYAIAFGIEKQWADKFKDIYKQQPEWYEGSTNLHDAYMVSRFMRGFSGAMNSTVYTHIPSGSGSASGSGWSGSFSGGGGGFSGGGGGGGSAGAF